MSRKRSQKRSMERLYWERAMPPAAFLEQAFEILSPCSHQCLTIDAPEPTQAKAPHAMPVFADRANKGSTQTWRFRRAFW